MQSLTTQLSESRTKGLRSERSVDIVVATPRAGSDGVVVSIVLPHQRRTMKRIMDQAGVDNY